MTFVRQLAHALLRPLLLLSIPVSLAVGCAPLPAGLEPEGGLRDVQPVVSVTTAKLEQAAQVVIQASRPFSYSLSNHERPARVLVEIPGSRFDRRVSQLLVNKGAIQTIGLQERDGQVKLEIALERLVGYEVQKGENRLVLRFKDAMDLGEPRENRDATRPPGASERPSQTAAQRPHQGLDRFARSPKEPGMQTEGGGLSNPLEYMIGGMDVLELVVYQEKDLSGTFRVSADGDIPFPLLGAVRVSGLTPPQAQQKLETLLQDGYLKHPQVSVTVKEYRSKSVSVFGAVGKPGAYQLSGGRTTLLELVSMAGGVSLEEGSKSLILVRPDETGGAKSITVDLDRLLKEGDASLNMTVQPNDTLYVTKADAIIVYGEVKSPGNYPFEGKEMTVLEAVSKAGGFTQYAAPNRTRIIRVERGVEKTIRVRVGDIIAKGERTKDVILQPGDVIVVPEGYF